MEHFTIPIDLRQAPECPICRSILYGKNTWFHKAFAICKVCFAGIDSRHLDLVAAAHYCQVAPTDWTTRHGLTFFVPSEASPQLIPVYEFGDVQPDLPVLSDGLPLPDGDVPAGGGETAEPIPVL